MMPSAHERGFIWGVISTVVRFVILPFVCEKAERTTVYLLWGTAWAMLLFAGLVANGTLPDTETMRIFAYIAAAIVFLLVVILGHWGSDVEEINESFEDPVRKLNNRW